MYAASMTIPSGTPAVRDNVDQQRSSVQENVQRIRGLKRDPARKSYVPFGIWIRYILVIPVTPEAAGKAAGMR